MSTTVRNEKRATRAQRTLSHALAARVAGLGIEKAFGLMGEDTAAFAASLTEDHGIDVYAMRHEAAAVMAADALSWSTDSLAVAIASHGPGFTNTATAAATAAKGGRKVLIVTGDNAVRAGMKPELKRIDQEAFAQSLGLAYFRVGEAATAGDVLDAATASARAGRTAVFAIPVDVLNGPASDLPDAAPAQVLEGDDDLEPSDQAVARVAELLAAAQRPLIIGGRGAIHAERELIELAERSGALLGTTLLGKGLFADHRLNLGIVGGWASDPARPVLDEFDVALVFGASLNSFTMAFGNLFQSATLIHVDRERSHIGANYNADVGVVADSRATARRLLERVPARNAAPLHEQHELARIAQPLYLGEDESVPGEADPRVLVQALDDMLPRERVFVTDSGHYMGFVGMYTRVYGPNRFRLTGTFASIGMGIGAAIGASVGRPDEQVVFVAGDGGLMSSLGDLETLSRFQLPIVVIVMNDRALGAERHSLEARGLAYDHAIYGDVDFASVARSLGIASASVSSPAELQALRPELSERRRTPFLVDCRIRGDLRARWLDEVIASKTNPVPDATAAEIY